MSPGRDRAPAPASTGATSDQQNTNDANDIRDDYTCAECGRRRVARGRHMCGRCIADYVAAIRRRHAADLRLSRWYE